jgi:rhamnogalacturonan acetylesterase
MRVKKIAAIKILLLFTALSSFVEIQQQHKPVLYIIGDSTVKNGDGTGKNGQVGWGSVITPYFDTTKITVLNLAIGGRSSRTFITDGRWDRILPGLQPGDFVMMQFGHNDGGALDDTARARGTIKGVGMDSIEIYNPIRKMKEVVYSYGWYMRKYVNDTKTKGATAIVCSPIPRNIFTDGKAERTDTSYTGWAKEVAASTGAYFINLNTIIGGKYDAMGPGKVKEFFPADHTHTNDAGAKLNAASVVEGLKKIPGCRLNNYLSAGQNK